MRKSLFPVLVLIQSFIYPQSQKFELPQVDPGEQIIYHTGYTLSYNEKHEQANWVAYELTAQELAGTVKRKDSFKSDPMVKTESASLADYRKSGYDRGHLIPAADMKWSTTAMSESFYMSNMSPQSPSFNRGIWKKLESQVRKWAKANSSLYIATAGVLEDNLQTIGPNQVSVPRYYYKVIVDYIEPEIKGIGFILPNEGSKKPIQSFMVTIDDVEVATGIDFFHLIPDKIEEQLENNVDMSKWIWN